VIWFLRRFSAYRNLELMLDDSQSHAEKQAGVFGQMAATKAQNESLRAENAALQIKLDALHEGRLADAKKTADFVAETRYGRAVFERISEIPVPQENFEPMHTTRPRAADLARQLEKQFWTDRRAEQTTPEHPAAA
jgi:hypothetical protein